MQLNVDGGERKEASHEELGERVAVPANIRGNFARNFVRSKIPA